MSPFLDEIRTLLRSGDTKLIAQALERMRQRGDAALYAELLSGWTWDRGYWPALDKSGCLGWSQGVAPPLHPQTATQVWIDAPLDTPFPPQLSLEAARSVAVLWRGQPDLLAKLRALPNLRSFGFWKLWESPPVPPLFSALPRALHSLDLAHSPAAGLDRLTGLRRLDLTRCSLRGMKLPPRLMSLRLDYCPVEGPLEPLLESVPLRRLDISLESADLARLPPLSLIGLPNLRSLVLRAMRDKLPDLSPLKDLRDLTLFANGMRALPPEIFGLSQLRRLSLDANWLYEIPAEIGGLSQLRSLRLTQNLLRSLPPTLGSLTALEELHLPDLSEMTRLPGWLPNLRRLRTLTLGAFGEARPPVDLLLSLPNLRRLHVHDSLLESAQGLARRAWAEQGRHIAVTSDAQLDH